MDLAMQLLKGKRRFEYGYFEGTGPTKWHHGEGHGGTARAALRRRPVVEPMPGMDSSMVLVDGTPMTLQEAEAGGVIYPEDEKRIALGYTLPGLKLEMGLANVHRSDERPNTFDRDTDFSRDDTFVPFMDEVAPKMAHETGHALDSQWNEGSFAQGEMPAHVLEVATREAMDRRRGRDPKYSIIEDAAARLKERLSRPAADFPTTIQTTEDNPDYEYDITDDQIISGEPMEIAMRLLKMPLLPESIKRVSDNRTEAQFQDPKTNQIYPMVAEKDPKFRAMNVGIYPNQPEQNLGRPTALGAMGLTDEEIDDDIKEEFNIGLSNAELTETNEDGPYYESDMTWTDPEKRRRGYASALYDLVDELDERKVRPSANQSDEGKQLWRKRMRPKGEPMDLAWRLLKQSQDESWAHLLGEGGMLKPRESSSPVRKPKPSPVRKPKPSPAPPPPIQQRQGQAPPAIQMDWINRDIMDRHPNKVFLFGDNNRRAGFGGQAKHMRGHPRAIGIRTKHAPSMHSSAMWGDDTYEDNIRMIDEDINRALSHNKQIVIPSAGIGTGLARLRNTAPRTFEYLQGRLQELREDQQAPDEGIHLGIVGSRNLSDYNAFRERVDDWVARNGKPDSIISGGQRGADTFARNYAEQNDVPFTEHHHNTYRHMGSPAMYHHRNQLVVDDSTHLLAFPSMGGRGTQVTMGMANEKGIPVDRHYEEDM